MGQKPRGSVVGDIPPENVLDPRDIRATGATSISELLDSIASQTGQRARPLLRSSDHCYSTASASPVSAKSATCRPKRSSGWKSCRKKSR